MPDVILLFVITLLLLRHYVYHYIYYCLFYIFIIQRHYIIICLLRRRDEMMITTDDKDADICLRQRALMMPRCYYARERVTLRERYMLLRMMSRCYALLRRRDKYAKKRCAYERQYFTLWHVDACIVYIRDETAITRARYYYCCYVYRLHAIITTLRRARRAPSAMMPTLCRLLLWAMPRLLLTYDAATDAIVMSDELLTLLRYWWAMFTIDMYRARLWVVYVYGYLLMR